MDLNYFLLPWTGALLSSHFGAQKDRCILAFHIILADDVGSISSAILQTKTQSPNLEGTCPTPPTPFCKSEPDTHRRNSVGVWEPPRPSSSRPCPWIGVNGAEGRRRTWTDSSPTLSRHRTGPGVARAPAWGCRAQEGPWPTPCGTAGRRGIDTDRCLGCQHLHFPGFCLLPSSLYLSLACSRRLQLGTPEP